jgi:PAS domain S-box-containing protein
VNRFIGQSQRYVASLTALSLLLVVLMAVSSIVLASHQVTGDVNKQVRTTASVSSVVVSEKISDLIALVESYATRSTLPTEVAAGVADNAQVELNLASLAHAFPGISASFIASLQGISLNTYPLEPTVIGMNFAYRDWYKGVVATGRPYLSNAIVTKEAGNPLAVTVTAYIEGPGGRPVGILGVNYGLGAIKSFATHVGRAQGITLTLTDRAGTSLTAGGAHGLVSLANDPRVRAALEGRSGFLTYAAVRGGGRRGPTELSAYEPIAGTGWAVVASVREDAAFAGLNRLRETVLAIAAMLVLILLGFGAIIARSGRRRREIELQVQSRDREMVQVLESIDEAFVSIDVGGQITSWNPRAETLCGWACAEVLGQNLADTVITSDHRGAFKEELAEYRTGVGSSLVGRRVEMTVLHRDGHAIPVELGVWAQDDGEGFSAFMHDITERLMAQAELAAARELAAQVEIALASGRASASLLASIVDSSVDAIVSETLNGTITSWNLGAEQMYGYAAKEVIGKNTLVLFPSDHLDELGETLDRIKGGGLVVQHDTQRVRKDGTVLDVSVTIAPILDINGVITGASVMARDISNRLTLERERRTLEIRLNQSERLESLGQLAGGIAHDFNNLLAVILNYATFVSEELEDTTAAQADLEQIRAAAERASALTRQLLAFARREVMQPKILNLNDVVSDVEELLRRTISEQIDLTISLAPEPWHVEADPGRLEQVLVNLVVNARDAMPDGGALHIGTANVDVDRALTDPDSVLLPGRYARLRISDTGSGMEKDVLDHVFEPFFTTKPHGDGTGLGLPMVFGIIRQAGGDIVLTSELGIGTTCDVYLPVTERAPLTDVRVDKPRALRGKETILVVEDEDALREVSRRILSRNGYDVMTSSNGFDAIALVEAYDGEIHLLLTDVIMPQMVGKEVAVRIQALRHGLPVLFMSGYAQPILGSTLGEGQALLEKPFTEQQLLAEVRDLLDTSIGAGAIR